VANLRGELKRAFLQSLFDAVVDGYASVDLASGVSQDLVKVLTFEAALKAFQRLGFNSLKSGKLSIGTSGMNHEIRFAAPDAMLSFRQDEVFAMAQEFREVFADAKLTLAAGGDDEPDDAAILRTMLAHDRLQSVDSTYRDFTMARCGNRY
jgi:hypothetical protein